MAYNLAPKDDRYSSYPSPNPSNRSYFTEQALRSAYSARIEPRETEFQRYETQFREHVERDPVRDQIRAEILEKEMARRRILEEEIRLELMLDREVAMQRWEASRMRGGEAAMASPSILHAPSRVYSEHPGVVPGRDVARFDLPGGVPSYVQESSPHQLGHYQGRMYPVMPVDSRPMVIPHQHLLMPVSGLGSRNIQYPLENRRDTQYPPGNRRDTQYPPGNRRDTQYPPGNRRDTQYPPGNRRDTTTLVKREANHSGPNMKRKPSSLGVDRPRGSNLEKKPRLWNCELCKVSTTDEKGLNDHLRGRRHKETLEGLSTGQKTGVGSSTTSDPSLKNPLKAHVKPSESNSAAEATIVDKKPISEPNSSVNIQKQGSIQKPGPPPTTPVKDESAKKPLPTKPVKGETPKRFSTWCKICKVGTNSEINMAIHEKGKKHLANIKGRRKAVPGSSGVEFPQ